MTTSSTKECPTCEGTGCIMSEEISFMPQNYDRFAEPVYEEVEIECPDCEGTGIEQLFIVVCP